MQDPAILTCGHTFDRPNLNTWLNTCMECPTCRTPVNTQGITTNYSMKSMISNLLESVKASTASSAYRFNEQATEVEVDNQVELKAVDLEALKEITGMD